MTLLLGGPGPACSVTRVRRLAAGELTGAELLAAEAHVAGCRRCRASRELLAAERRELEAALPFEAFAAGVAERLAVDPAHESRGRPATGDARSPIRLAPWRTAWATRGLPAALAAALLLAGVAPLVWRATHREQPGHRVKGSAAIAVYLHDGTSARVLAPGEPVPRGARLRVALAPGARRHAAVALVDADGVALLHGGEAADGPLADAFQWTGEGDGALVALLADDPIDARAFTALLERGGVAGAAAGDVKGELVVFRLRREGPR